MSFQPQQQQQMKSEHVLLSLLSQSLAIGTITKRYFNSAGISVISTECSQSLNLAGTCVCRPDLVTWLFGWKEMSLPRTTMISSSGLGLAGLSEVFSVEVGMTGLASSIRVAGATGLLPTLVGVVAAVLMSDS